MAVSQVSAGNHPILLDDTPCIFNMKHQCRSPSSGPYQCLSHLPLVLQPSLLFYNPSAMTTRNIWIKFSESWEGLLAPSWPLLWPANLMWSQLPDQCTPGAPAEGAQLPRAPRLPSPKLCRARQTSCKTDTASKWFMRCATMNR